jgi:hypothetical protein
MLLQETHSESKIQGNILMLLQETYSESKIQGNILMLLQETHSGKKAGTMSALFVFP